MFYVVPLDCDIPSPDYIHILVLFRLPSDNVQNLKVNHIQAFSSSYSALYMHTGFLTFAATSSLDLYRISI